MRTAILLGRKRGSIEWTILATPEVPIEMQREKFKELKVSTINGTFDRIEYWESDAGRRQFMRFESANEHRAAAKSNAEALAIMKAKVLNAKADAAARRKADQDKLNAQRQKEIEAKSKRTAEFLARVHPPKEKAETPEPPVESVEPKVLPKEAAPKEIAKLKTK